MCVSPRFIHCIVVNALDWVGYVVHKGVEAFDRSRASQSDKSTTTFSIITRCVYRTLKIIVIIFETCCSLLSASDILSSLLLDIVKIFN
jgi:hypothetical protein